MVQLNFRDVGGHAGAWATTHPTSRRSDRRNRFQKKALLLRTTEGEPEPLNVHEASRSVSDNHPLAVLWPADDTCT
ncbi:hypothetical protein GCM10010405_54900 [Streptomyces macrosporus]|uniref:Uncharacterized protein n=1 Tax=Streptomyces macrosporus TaxID=44032 RepID=A0ABN3KJT0_9ACTN